MTICHFQTKTDLDKLAYRIAVAQSLGWRVISPDIRSVVGETVPFALTPNTVEPIFRLLGSSSSQHRRTPNTVL